MIKFIIPNNLSFCENRSFIIYHSLSYGVCHRALLDEVVEVANLPLN